MGMYVGMSFRTDSLVITPEILALISEIEEFKGAWRALGTLAPERLSALRRVATLESIGFYADRRQQANGQRNRESAIQS